MKLVTPCNKPVICVVGPTASGKSEIAQLIAEQIDGAIVSADSMQIYRGMDIGTGKVKAHERRVPHYGLDMIEPGEPYSAALFQVYAREQFLVIQNDGMWPILCGGTGFYVRAAIDDYRFPAGEQKGNAVRDRYADLAEKQGAQAVWDALFALDEQSARMVHPNNVKRVIRALELFHEGSSYAEQVEKLKSIPQAIPAMFIGLHVEPSILLDRIDARVDAMMDSGLLSEVHKLLDLGFRDGITARQAIGYKELVDYIDGKSTLDEAIESIKVATHQYAKRQRSWFRKDSRIKWISADDANGERIVGEAFAIIEDQISKAAL